MDNQALIKQEDMTAMAGGRPSTITVMIIDRSGSMSGYEEPVLTAVNNHLQAIKNPPDGREQYCMIITFSDSYRIDVMLQHASNIDKMTEYKPDDNTLLWKTVYKTIKLFLEPYSAMTTEQKENVKIFFGVFSDGEDNLSNQVDEGNPWPEKLQRMTKKALAQGFELLTFGFRFNVKQIAGSMGFPIDDEHAFQFAQENASIARAGQTFTHRTTTVFCGRQFDPGRRKP